MAEEHRHRFKIRWKIIDGKLLIHPTCSCNGCEMQATIRQNGQGIVVTFIEGKMQVSYPVALYEEE